jgi:hypothetical protein
MTRQATDPSATQLLTLDDALLIALDNHPNLQAARERIAAQRAVLGQQMAAYYPTVSLANQYKTSQTQKAQDAHATPGSETYSSETKFNFTLYNFGKREGAVQAARETLNATDHNYKTTVDSVILDVKLGYYVYLGAKAIVKVREEQVQSRDLLVRQARAFYEVGTRARIDVVRAESNLYTAQADLIATQNAVKVAWVTLKKAMGLRELPERPLVEEAIMTTIPYTLDQAKEIAYATRPELKSFEAQRKAQDQLPDEPRDEKRDGQEDDVEGGEGHDRLYRAVDGTFNASRAIQVFEACCRGSDTGRCRGPGRCSCDAPVRARVPRRWRRHHQVVVGDIQQLVEHALRPAIRRQLATARAEAGLARVRHDLDLLALRAPVA